MGKKFLALFGLAAYGIGSLGGLIAACRIHDGIIAACVITLAVMAFPVAKKCWDELNGESKDKS